jgi:hypothetical protein
MGFPDPSGLDVLDQCRCRPGQSEQLAHEREHDRKDRLGDLGWGATALLRGWFLRLHPSGCTFNGQANVLPPAYLATLSVGDVLDNDDQNPLVWHR